MLSRLSSYFKQNVIAFLALFVAMGGTGAYAVNTVNSSDIVDGEVKSVDIGNGEVNSADVKDQSLTTFDVSTFLGADIVDGSLTGADLAADSIGPQQVREENLAFNNTLVSGDLGTGSVQSAEVSDGSLKDEDIAESTFNFQGDIGTVDAHTCRFPAVTGVGGQGDHLLLTPNWNTASSELSYGAEYRSDTGTVALKVCNPTDGPVVDGMTTFNLLVINAN